MNSRATACTTTSKLIEYTSKSRCSATTGRGAYYRMICASINMKKRQRPRITAGLPVASLLFSFGPTMTKKDNPTAMIMMTDAILEDVLARTIATTTPPPQSSEKVPQQEHRLIQRVSFSTKTDVKYIPSRHEISSKEYKDAWYSRAELDSISESCLEQIHHAITSNRNNYCPFRRGGAEHGNGTNIDEEEESSCIRGLESFTPVALKAKNMHRSLSVQTILKEQNRHKQQRRGGRLKKGDSQNDDDHTEALRMIYHGISHSSQLWAHAVALRDRREVEDMMIDDEECSTGKTSAIIATSLAVVDEKPLLRSGDGDSRSCRRRVTCRRYSSKSSSYNTIQLSPKITAKTMPLLDGQEEATFQMVMAIAA